MGDDLTGPAAVTVAFDSGPEVGLGHQRRAEAVARALEDRGVRCQLTGLIGRPTARPGRAIVVDSYRWRADCHELFTADFIAAIDDLTRDLDVDLVIDPSPGARVSDHAAASSALVGAAYAIVDPSLLLLPRRACPPEVSSILVATGGADRDGHGLAMARSVGEAIGGRAHVRLALGPGVDVGDAGSVEIVRRVDGLGPELASADLVVTAGGVTMLEALSLARPTIVVILAENQRRPAVSAAAAGAALLVDEDEVAAAVACLAADQSRRAEMGLRASALLDGHGAQRVAEAIHARL